MPEVESECINFVPSVELLEGLGDITKYPFNPKMISIEKQAGDSVVFSITQKVMEISNLTAGFLSVHYEAKPDTHDCVAVSGDAASLGKTFEYTAVCEHGQASVSIYLRNDGTPSTECDACSAPGGGDADFVAYYLSIPCEPACIPSEPECYGGIMAMKKDTGADAMCNYVNQPFFIEQLDETGSNEVAFSFTNNWSSEMTDVTLLFETGDGEGPDCVSLASLGPGVKYDNILTATCDPATKTAQVEVYVSSASIGFMEAKTKCDVPESGGCSFTYKIPCSAEVMCGGLRRLVEVVGDDGGIAAEAEQGFMTDEMRAAGQGAGDGEDPEDIPYCVHEDYPCQGDEEVMVYVCHYSTRAGYQTFCIPEADSDIMRFYSNDYCGPCEGWNGVTHAGQAI
jgi:hypothetical protein